MPALDRPFPSTFCSLVKRDKTVGVLRSGGQMALLNAIFFAAQLFRSAMVLGISCMLLYYLLFELQGNMLIAIIAIAVHCFSCCFLIMAAMLCKYDWRMNEALIVCGASRCYRSWRSCCRAPGLASWSD
ncbi:hypothetical protein [Pararhizobium sp.]|uniref:hypothetical protein n=1 Tax=Pararhizobium sp. TaxID=1977563 RepID=UPI002719D812|nr:hypothetical protein [Pararhizobium sp.]MDO9417942.1 hypothetical protein [Pararhizobium sp.]